MISGFLTLGRLVSGVFVPFEHDRAQVTLGGRPDCLDTICAVANVTGRPAGSMISHGAVFAAEGGQCLVHWGWLPPLREPPCNWPALDVSVGWSFRLGLALNASLAGIRAEISIASGDTVGTINGQPMVSATNLTVVGGAVTLAVVDNRTRKRGFAA